MSFSAITPTFRERQMQYFHISARLGLLTMLALSVLFAACARGPVPPKVNPVKFAQERVQAAEHWRDIAVDVADKVRDALVARDDLSTRPIHVVSPDSRDFMLAFYQLLKTELVSRGIQVSDRREADTVVLDYNVLLITHDPSRSSRVPENEIVVNTRLAHNNRFVVHLSSIRYINDKEWAMYYGPEALNPGSGGTRTVRVLNR